MTEIEQIDIGEVTRRYSEEEAGRLMKEVMENNVMIIKSQKQIMELQIAAKEEERRREIRRQIEKEEEETDKWMEECRKRNEKEKEEKEEQRRLDEEWRKVEKMRIREERKAEKEWRQQEIRDRRREENRQRAMEERKCFGCGGFGHIANHCKNIGKEEPTLVSSNRFKVLKVRVMQRGEGSSK